MAAEPSDLPALAHNNGAVGYGQVSVKTVQLGRQVGELARPAYGSTPGMKRSLIRARSKGTCSSSLLIDKHVTGREHCIRAQFQGA